MAEEKKVVIEGLDGNRLADRINSSLNGKKELYKALEIILFAVFAFQFIIIAYFNLFQIKYHLGFDASSVMLRARMVWEQKTLLPKNYVEQTNFNFDSSMPVAALIYGICGDVCTAFGITNILSSVCIVVLFYFIAKKLSLSRAGTLFGLVFLTSPYVSPDYNTANPLDYFPAMFFSTAFLSVMVIYAFLVFAAVIYLSDKESSRVLTVVFSAAAVAMSFYLAVSKGIALFLYTVAPVVLYLIVRTLAHKDIRCFFNRILVFLIVEAAAIAAGQLFASRVAGFSSMGASIELIQLGDFWTNFGNIFLGLGKLLNVGNAYKTTTVSSFSGIIYLVHICVMAVYLFGIVYAVTRIVKNKAFAENDGFCFVVCFCFVNYFAYALINSTYGAAVFEERYLILFFVFSLFLLGYFIDTFEFDFFKKMGIIFTAAVVTVSAAVGCHSLNIGKYTEPYELAKLLEKYDEKTVYSYNVTTANLHILTRDLRALDKTKVYKLIDNGVPYHWGDYTYCDDIGDDTGPVLLIINAGTLEQLPEYCRKNIAFSEAFGSYEIYRSEKNVFDFETGLDDDGYSVDIPNTNGVVTVNMEMDENGGYVTDGTEGYCMYGPYAPTMTGDYRFTLNYKVKSCGDGEKAGAFDVAVSSGAAILGSADIRTDSESVSIDVSFSEGDTFEYRVWNYPVSVIVIDSVEREKLY